MPDVQFLPTRTGVEVATVYRAATAAGVTGASCRMTIIFAHGSGSDLGFEAPYLRHYELALGCSVIGVDYPGYGRSGGRPSEDGAVAALEAAYDAAVAGGVFAPEPVEPGDIIVFGVSMGTAAALRLAAARPVGALILESPLLSVVRTRCGCGGGAAAVREQAACCASWDLFNTVPLLERVRCPVLLRTGGSDGVVPPWHTDYLAEHLPRVFLKEVVPGAGHYDVRQVLKDRAYFEPMRALVRSVAERHAASREHSVGSADDDAPGVYAGEVGLEESGGGGGGGCECARSPTAASFASVDEQQAQEVYEI